MSIPRSFVLLNLATHGSAPALTRTLIRELDSAGRLTGVVVSEHNELLDRISADIGSQRVTTLRLPSRADGASRLRRILTTFSFLARFVRTTAVRDVLIPNPHPHTTLSLPLLRLLGIHVHSGIHDFRPHEGDRLWFVRLTNLITCLFSSRVLFFSRSQHGLALRHWPWFSRCYGLLRLPTEYQREHTDDGELRAFDFLFFGRIERYKGMELLLAAFDRVRAVRPDVRLHIAGAGQYRCRALDEAVDPMITKTLRYVPDRELAGVLLGAKVIVLPYISATQSGVAHLGAVYGLNVACTPCEGLIEQAEHNPRMRISADFTPQALADTMLTSLDAWTSEIGRSSLVIHSGIADLP